jgi:hypothetical protein
MSAEIYLSKWWIKTRPVFVIYDKLEKFRIVNRAIRYGDTLAGTLEKEGYTRRK